MSIVTSIIFKKQNEGTPEEFDSWFVYFDDKVPEMVIVDPGTVAVYNDKLLYHKRKDDGVSAYLNIAAEFRTAGGSRPVNKAIENKLKNVRDELVNGQWVSALEELEDVNVNSANFTQEMKDRFELSLNTYINNVNNYPII